MSYVDNNETNRDILTQNGFSLIQQQMYTKLKTTELINICKRLNLNTNGTNEVLVQRINVTNQRIGISYLERALAKNATPAPYSINEFKGKTLAMWCGRLYYQQGDFEKARQLIDMAATSSLSGDGAAIQKATLRYTLAAHSSKSEEAKAYLHEGNELTQNLLKRDLDLSKVMDPANDHYVYCLFSSFYIETLYEVDWRKATNNYYKLAIKAWPALQYTNVKKEKPDSIIKIGIVSAFLHKSNSVIRDFGETLKRLSKDKFSLHLIYLKEQDLPISQDCKSWNARSSDFLEVNNETLPLIDGVPKWLSTTRTKVANMKLDMMLYLDLTMSSMAHRLAMSRLAPIQVTSHGHPVSSGIDTIDYYISWKAAEIDTADEHYTEKLVLLPSDTMHQYHNPVFVNGKSTVTNEMVPLEKREKLFPNINGKSRWYVCMQKPFKLHACFGNMLQKILDEDPECIIILHAGAERWNLDKKRVVFLNPLPHHELLALYREADVVLDSYYAGGCTTSREAFEMNSVVVTLPAKYLGGRWTLAFYDILGVTDAVAVDKDDYVRLAVTIGRDDTLRNSIKSKIAKNIHKMWRCEKAVDNWSNALLNIAKGNK